MSSALLLKLVASAQPASIIQCVFSMCHVQTVKCEPGNCPHEAYLGADEMQLPGLAKSGILCALITAASGQTGNCKLPSYTTQVSPQKVVWLARSFPGNPEGEEQYILYVITF